MKYGLLRLFSVILALVLVLSACQSTPPTVTPGESIPDGDSTPDNPPTPDSDPIPEGEPAPDDPTDPEILATATTVKWSDPVSWGSRGLPKAGENVEIPKGTAMLLDVSPPELEGLVINGTLVFANTDINLTAEWIMVHGRLELGVPLQPYTHEAVITLTGADEDVMGMGMGGRVLGVMDGGTLVMAGQKRTSWTKLGVTANKGDRTLTLAKTVDWQPGDSIVIASTDFAYEQAETFKIQSIAGTTVTLDKPLQYMHYGGVQTYNGKRVDQRAEVGLLSRNIVIQGRMASLADRFGGHVMVMTGGRAFVNSAEFVNMGQENKMGRYPIHWHMMGDSSRGQYVRNSSVHDSFNRCVTIHGSNGVKVQSNVTYNIPGHCFFLEDGAEIDNIIENNLAMRINEPATGKNLLPSDVGFLGPAAYWITHPKNIVRNNVAAGSQGTGFWYAFPEHPTGASANSSIFNRYTPLGESRNNVAHSNNDDGFHIDNGPKANVQAGTEPAGYEPHLDPNAIKTESWGSYNTSAPATATFQNLVAYKNRRNGIWSRGRYHLFESPILSDNAIGVTFASDESILRNGLIVGETNNFGTPTTWEVKGENGRSLPRPWTCADPLGCSAFPVRGFEFYDGTVGVEDTHFAGFKDNSIRKASALSYLNFTGFSTSPHNYAKGLTFAPDTKRVNLFTRGTPVDPSKDTEDGYRSAVFVDQDGSVTGTANRTVVVDNPFMLASNCTKNSEWNAWICNDSYVRFNLGAASAITSTTLSLAGKTHTLYGTGTNNDDNFFSILRAKQTYGVTFQGGVPSKFSLTLRDAPKDWVRFTIPLSAAPSVTGYNVKAAANLAALETSTLSTYFYDIAGQTLHVKLLAMNPWDIGKGLDYISLEVQP
jgi:cell surface hyaluronidase